MSTLSTSVQVLTKNKPYYLKTNLGLMKIRSELLSATPRSQFENLRNVREMFEQGRKPKNTEIDDVVSTYSEQVLAHSNSHNLVPRVFSLVHAMVAAVRV